MQTDAPGAPRADAAEIEKFDRLAAGWWDLEGPFAPLHKMNPARLAFIRQQACDHFGRDARVRPLSGLRAVDLGCGGGLVAEPLARMGADVTGLDAAPEAVRAAQAHARAVGLNIEYREGAAEDLAAEGRAFDLVVALEIVEHVPSVPDFCAAAKALVAPGGLLIMSTINRTARARALAIVLAEHVLRWAEPGTHAFEKLVTPDELRAALAPFAVDGPFGLVFDPLERAWRLGADSSVNYFMTAAQA